MILIKFKKESLAALEVRLWVGKSRSRKICLEVVRVRVEVVGWRQWRGKRLKISIFIIILTFTYFLCFYVWCQLKNNMG